MFQQTIQQRRSLLADPVQVALVRELIRHARHVNAEHNIYPGGRSASGAHWPAEHAWTAGPGRVLIHIHDGWLIYVSHGSPLLKAQVDNARQVGQLLAAIGVLPQRFAGGALDAIAAIEPKSHLWSADGHWPDCPGCQIKAALTGHAVAADIDADRPCCDFAEATGGDTHATGCANGVGGGAR